MTLENCTFGQQLKTRKGDGVFFIRKDPELKSKYLVAHPYWGALLYNEDGSCLTKGIDEDDIIDYGSDNI